jgi:hypothetical protein
MKYRREVTVLELFQQQHAGNDSADSISFTSDIVTLMFRYRTFVMQHFVLIVRGFLVHKQTGRIRFKC